MEDKDYFAHSGCEPGGAWEPLREHLEGVARRTAEYAGAFGAEIEGRLAGLLHDVGKYGDLFVRRLAGKEKGLDHWSMGAYLLLAKYGWNAFAASLAVQGHHVGLQSGAQRELLDGLNPDLLGDPKRHPRQLRLTESDADLLLRRFAGDGLALPPPPPASAYSSKTPSAAGMLDARMLFSALVDADFLETEAHFLGDPDGSKHYRREGPVLDPKRSWEALTAHLDAVRSGSRAAPEVDAVREDLLSACLEAAQEPTGVFTLTAPTGAGKTLALLAFALRHAAKHGLRRVVTVIPYLTIIEQAASIYRKAFAQAAFDENYVLEHHSLAGRDEEPTDDDRDNEDAARRTARLLSENWDAPIVVTTSVQFLESLHASQPKACRKLHRLSQSVIILDEVQTLPPRLAVPTLATLSRLAERYGSTVVFSTATQPAFRSLDTEVRKYGPAGWAPREIVPEERLRLFARARRTSVQWDIDSRLSWERVADRLLENERVLCVVNLKRHAMRLAQLLKERAPKGLFHLSTNMCPAHREKALAEVLRRLDSGEVCRLVSTQCVEAGVDVDFPTVWRAFGPLDSIAQAAGRCNRNGKLGSFGKVHVFLPEDEGTLYPPGAYRQAAETTETLLRARGAEAMDIHDPAIFETYYRRFYGLTGATEVKNELADAICVRNFAKTAAEYRLIPTDSINVLVPYDPERFAVLTAELESQGRLTVHWIRRARAHVVSVFRPRDDDSIVPFLLPAPLGRHTHERSDEWFVYLCEDHYDRELLGLKPPGEFDASFA